MLTPKIVEAAQAALRRGERFFELERVTYRAEPLAGVGAGALPLDVDPNFPCYCNACASDGQHEAGCSVHVEPAWSMEAGTIEALNTSWSTRNWERYIEENEAIASTPEAPPPPQAEPGTEVDVWSTPSEVGTQ